MSVEDQLLAVFHELQLQEAMDDVMNVNVSERKHREKSKSMHHVKEVS